MVKYKKYAMPIEAWKNFKLKQEKMNDTIKAITGKNKNIPLTKVILATSKKPLWFENEEIVKLSRKNGRKI